MANLIEAVQLEQKCPFCGGDDNGGIVGGYFLLQNYACGSSAHAVENTESNQVNIKFERKCGA
jgi:hypothetical protein